MVYIICEPLYSESPWCKTIFEGLIDALEKNRIKYSTTFNNIDTAERSFAFLIGSVDKWLDDAITLCESKVVHPIVLSSQSDNRFNVRCSCITSNVRHSVQRIVDYFLYNNKRKLALYGVNRNSVTNMTQLMCFASCLGERFDPSDVYYNDGSLSECSDRVIAEIHKYDAVVSVNDFATVLLLNKLPQLPEKTSVISYGGTAIAKKFFPGIITVSMGYENFGKAAVSVLYTLMNSEAIDYVNVTIKCEVDDELSDCSKQKDEYTSSYSQFETSDTRFYSDDALLKMMSIENMLCSCDTTDMEIIDLLLNGDSYEVISEKLFCAENTVKYRVKKMKENCGCETKKELTALVKKYCDFR